MKAIRDFIAESHAGHILGASGSVVGVDVGYSTKRKTSAICRLDWTKTSLCWSIKRFRAIEPERTSAIYDIIGDALIEVAAFDGPLRSDLDEIGHYRSAESMLTKRLGEFIGKPGQSSTPVGKSLNNAANICARIVLDKNALAKAGHSKRIHERAIVEAFPSSFLGVMIDKPKIPKAKRKNRSDLFFQALTDDHTLARLLAHLLSDRRPTQSLQTILNHDDRAAFVCAVTALCVAVRDFVAVGDADGWIILPPQEFIQRWAFDLLQENAIETPQ